MKTRLLLIALACALGIVRAAAAQGSAEPADSLFAQGNRAYAAGDYDAAVADYQQLVSRGVVNADLYYNLGNASFESGELGRAVLWYERARRVNPRHDDARANLELVRSLLRDKQLVVEESAFKRTSLAWHRRTTAGESVGIACALWALLGVLAVLFIFRREPGVDRFLRRMSVLSPGRLFGLEPGQDVALAMAVTLVLGGLFAGSSWVKIRAARDATRGVIVAEEVSVFSGPSRDATVQFKVHEGTAVAVRETRPGWIRVDLPGDLSGWVDAGTLERI